jgi:hypothetical protein
LYAEALNATQEGHPAMQDMMRVVDNILMQEGVADGIRQGGVYDYMSRVVLAQASMLGFRDTFIVVSVACLLAVGPAMLLRRKAA